MIERELPLDENLYESFPAMKLDFPYVWFFGEMDKYIDGFVPWHWHEEPEFCHVLLGEVEYHIAGQILILNPGDGIFVNSNVMHMLRPHNGLKGTLFIPQIFNKLLLIGYHRSTFDKKYYRPIVTSKTVPYFLIRSKEQGDATFIQLLQKSYEISKAEKFGYEFHLRNLLSDLWLELFNTLSPVIRSPEDTPDLYSSRIKKMMTYIENHYAENITLKSIATSASISERECNRHFQKQIHETPLQYLQEFRIDNAANLLLHSDMSITDVALKSGFENSSYFSKVFKQHMHCTPKVYRNTSPQNIKI